MADKERWKVTVGIKPIEFTGNFINEEQARERAIEVVAAIGCGSTDLVVLSVERVAAVGEEA